MEIIRKIINLQESKSFKSGLLPFIPFNGVFSGDTVPITVCENGITNYGGFVNILFGKRKTFVRVIDIKELPSTRTAAHLINYSLLFNIFNHSFQFSCCNI
jgi:hypothetical protein